MGGGAGIASIYDVAPGLRESHSNLLDYAISAAYLYILTIAGLPITQHAAGCRTSEPSVRLPDRARAVYRGRSDDSRGALHLQDVDDVADW